MPKITTGFDLLPGAIIDQHFLYRNRFTRLQTAIRTHPDRLGVGIDEDTAMFIGPDHSFTVEGSGTVTIIDGVTVQLNLKAGVRLTEKRCDVPRLPEGERALARRDAQRWASHESSVDLGALELYPDSRGIANQSRAGIIDQAPQS